MKSNLLMNCLWYEDIPPGDLANILKITPEALFKKLFQEDDFTPEEIHKIVDLLELTEDEAYAIFEADMREVKVDGN